MKNNPKISITKTVTFTKTKKQWIQTDFQTVAEIFDLHVRAFNALKVRGIEVLGDLLLHSKEELFEGKYIDVSLSDPYHVECANKVNEKCKSIGRLGSKKVGEASMKEIEVMLYKLGMKLRKN